MTPFAKAHFYSIWQMYCWKVFLIFFSTLSVTLYFHSLKIDLSTACLLYYASIKSIRPSMMLVLVPFTWHIFGFLYLGHLVNNILNLLFFYDAQVASYYLLVIFNNKKDPLQKFYKRELS